MAKHDATLGNHPLPAVMGRSNAGNENKANTLALVSGRGSAADRDGAENGQRPAKNTRGDTPGAFYMTAGCRCLGAA